MALLPGLIGGIVSGITNAAANKVNSAYKPSVSRPSRPSSSTGSSGSSGSVSQGSTGTNVDYSVLINNAINSGASWQDVQDLVNQRVNKATGNSDLNKYAYDNVYSNAMNYINQQKNQESMDRYQDYMDQMNSTYDQVAADQAAAKQAAVEQAVNSLTSQKSDIEQSYDDLYRQLYLDRRRAEKNLPQQMAAMGISGGLTESTALGLQTDYTDALRQGEQEKLSTLNSLDQAISDAKLTGDIESAQSAAQLALDRLNSYGSILSQIQEQQNWANQMAYQQQQDRLAYNRQSMLDQLSRDDVSFDRKLQIAQYLYENTGDASGFRSLGMTDAQIAALQNSYALAMQQYAAPSSSGTSSSGNPVSEETATPQYDNGGSGGVELDSAKFANLLNLLGGTLEEDVAKNGGYAKYATQAVDAVWNQLSAAQKSAIQQIFGQYGYQYNP